ncbi:G-type lectin S-receptor-like serine/threonine-protein kinase SD2-5 [Lolium rigidum]|uniref:G-type lectin S-receptor-like serine/threonine-protein kinase SD2-5 n=1 Tax=Lolium rigidum TaxID=89674 RepID=UPI001F5DDAEA|nr:G-type lectin S-receptor-like serine/threonine-protein kinase SD2-5 [Lolium rigidum]
MQTQMPAMSASSALNLLPLLLLLLAATSCEATTINITNRCSYTVWPATVQVGTGERLKSGQVWTLDVPANASSWRIWARTGCSFSGNGIGSCQTGDCGGALACKILGKPPTTFAEFMTGSTQDSFEISLLDGFNVPMDFLPVPVKGENECSKGPRCAADITSQCPEEIKVPGGCNNTCTGTGSSNCTYSGFFKRMCPDAHTLPEDSAKYACPAGMNYQVTFCPPINLAISPAAMSPPPTPTLETTPSLSSPPLAPIGSRRTKRRVTSRVIAILASVCSFILVSMLFTITFYICTRRAQWKHREMEEEEEFRELQGTPMRFTFQQLKLATEQFADKLGEGGFGSVFKGQFGEESIAVKRLDRAGQGKREFSAEVHTIGSIHHINLVRLIGFCAEKSHRLLVYEYMPKGSLDRWIYRRHDNNAPSLDWSTRCKIITHIAKGLSYLHEDCTKRIAHLDVKPQNILLDDNFNAKLSDFGLCKLIDRDISQVVTRMRGTPGYLAPEWLTSQITEKADIYSFGVVVMEVISGRKNIDTSRSEESIHLITLLEEKVKYGNLVDLIDKNSNDMHTHEQDVIQMMKLAMWCLQIDCKRRPRMSEVVKVLEGNMNTESNIDHNFVATNQATFDTAGNVSSSVPPIASHVSGPR